MCKMIWVELEYLSGPSFLNNVFEVQTIEEFEEFPIFWRIKAALNSATVSGWTRALGLRLCLPTLSSPGVKIEPARLV